MLFRKRAVPDGQQTLRVRPANDRVENVRKLSQNDLLGRFDHLTGMLVYAVDKKFAVA